MAAGTRNTGAGGGGRRNLKIAFEGVIGVGKTTLAQALAEELGAVRLFEDEIHNPYLKSFYKHRSRYALPCQLYFLEARLAQFARNLPYGVPVVADHSMIKERLFADVNLEGEDRALYFRLHERLASQAGFTPEVVVYLSAPLDEVKQRIRARGRRMENAIDVGYLHALIEAYHQWFAEVEDRLERVVVINADGAGLANDRGAVARLADACAAARPGIQYCNPR
ncbi:MAG: deoxynucleoside kinase [Planctomycetota bacterium]